MGDEKKPSEPIVYEAKDGYTVVLPPNAIHGHIYLRMFNVEDRPNRLEAIKRLVVDAAKRELYAARAQGAREALALVEEQAQDCCEYDQRQAEALTRATGIVRGILAAADKAIGGSDE